MCGLAGRDCLCYTSLHDLIKSPSTRRGVPHIHIRYILTFFKSTQQRHRRAGPADVLQLHRGMDPLNGYVYMCLCVCAFLPPSVHSSHGALHDQTKHMIFTVYIHPPNTNTQTHKNQTQKPDRRRRPLHRAGPGPQLGGPCRPPLLPLQPRRRPRLQLPLLARPGACFCIFV